MNVRLFTINGNPRDTLTPVPFKGLYFPGGEPYVELPYNDLKNQNVLVDGRIGSMNDFGMLLAVLQALVEIPSTVFLLIPYFPGGRADRVGYGDGTALTVQMYADIINGFSPERVFILDAHSDVTPALVHRSEVITIADIFATMDRSIFPKYDAIICPDQGAEKRTATAAAALGIERIVRASKHRNMATGRLSDFHIESLSEFDPGASFLIVDDICDGGGTFVGIADLVHRRVNQSLRRLSGGGEWMTAEIVNRGFNVDLWVTHGIFSKGPMALRALADGPGFRHVFQTDSYPSYRVAPGVAGTFEYPATADDFSPGFTTIPVLPTLTQLILDRI